MRAAITVVGKDQVGILAAVSNACADHQANIVDVSQTIMQQYFTMMMLVEIDQLTVGFEDFQEIVAQSVPQMQVHVMHEDIFNEMHKV